MVALDAFVPRVCLAAKDPLAASCECVRCALFRARATAARLADELPPHACAAVHYKRVGFLVAATGYYTLEWCVERRLAECASCGEVVRNHPEWSRILRYAYALLAEEEAVHTRNVEADRERYPILTCACNYEQNTKRWCPTCHRMLFAGEWCTRCGWLAPHREGCPAAGVKGLER